MKKLAIITLYIIIVYIINFYPVFSVSDESIFINELNNVRRGNKLNILYYNVLLSNFAKKRAEYIMKIQYFDKSHPGFHEMASEYFKDKWVIVYECVVWSYDEKIISPSQALQILLNSPPHRKALLSGNVDKIGVYYLKDFSKKLKQVWVVILGKERKFIGQDPEIQYHIHYNKIMLYIKNIGGDHIIIYLNGKKVYESRNNPPFYSFNLSFVFYPFIPNKIIVVSDGFCWGADTVKQYRKTIVINGWLPYQIIFFKKIISVYIHSFQVRK